MKKMWLWILALLLAFGFAVAVMSCGGGGGDDDDDTDDDDAAPEAPSDLTVAAVEGGIELSWTDNSDNESGFYVYRQYAETKEFTKIGEVGADVTTYLDSTFECNNDATYYVTAFNDVGESEPSNEASTGFIECPAIYEDLISDDGSAENGLEPHQTNCGPQSMSAKFLTPTHYPSYLSKIKIWVAQDTTTPNYTIRVYQDATGGNPNDATMVWESPAQNQQGANNWLEFDVEAELSSLPLTAGTWVIAVYYNSFNLFVGWDQNTGGQHNSYLYCKLQSQWLDIEAVAFPGTWMMRATAYYYE